MSKDPGRWRWKDVFDTSLRDRAARSGDRFTPFDAGRDYERFVDGMPRLDGTRSFLAARGFATVHAISNLKNEMVLLRPAAA